jgi:hypothetical protein
MYHIDIKLHSFAASRVVFYSKTISLSGSSRAVGPSMKGLRIRELWSRDPLGEENVGNRGSSKDSRTPWLHPKLRGESPLTVLRLAEYFQGQR